MKILYAVLTILFVLFAVVQYNDPDPWLWIALYLYIAVMTGLAFFDRFYKGLLQVGLLFCLVKLGLLLPSFVDWIGQGAPSIVESMKAEQPHIELTREFLGLTICVAVLGYLYRGLRKEV